MTDIIRLIIVAGLLLLLVIPFGLLLSGISRFNYKNGWKLWNNGPFSRISRRSFRK